MRKTAEDFYILFRDKFYERFKRVYLRPFAKVEAWYGFMTFVYEAMREHWDNEDGLDQFDEEQFSTFKMLLPYLSDGEICAIFDYVETNICDGAWDELCNFRNFVLGEIYDMEDHLYTYREFAELSKQVDNIDENELTRLDFTGVNITMYNRIFYENERRRAGLLDEDDE